jgi:hypothetical protein
LNSNSGTALATVYTSWILLAKGKMVLSLSRTLVFIGFLLGALGAVLLILGIHSGKQLVVNDFDDNGGVLRFLILDFGFGGGILGLLIMLLAEYMMNSSIHSFFGAERPNIIVQKFSESLTNTCSYGTKELQHTQYWHLKCLG